MKNVLSDLQLHKEWTDTVKLLEIPNIPEDIIKSTGQAMMLKMLHTQFKEFATKTRILEILNEGKSADHGER